MQETQSFYDDGRIYDLMYGDWAEPETLAFYERQIALYGEPVLELACGTGRYLIPLAEKGIEIIGSDISGAMLERAGEKAAARNVAPDLRLGDIRDFELKRRFPLILLLGNSLQHLLTLAEVERCFAAVKRHLQPGGRFIVEVFNPSLKILTRDPEETVVDSEYETAEGKMILTGKVNYDAATQINYITWQFRTAAGAVSREMPFTMRQFFPQELDALLAYNNFRIEQKFGERDGSPFDSQSRRQIVVVSSL